MCLALVYSCGYRSKKKTLCWECKGSVTGEDAGGEDNFPWVEIFC